MVFVLEYNISKLYYYISEEEAIVVQQLFLLHYVAKAGGETDHWKIAL